MTLLLAVLVLLPFGLPTASPSRPESCEALERVPNAAEREEMRSLASRILEAANSGRLILVNATRDRKQIEQLAGPEPTSPFTVELVRVIDTLTERSTAEKPLRVISLFRPLKSGRPSEPHGKGQAVDIAAFAGYDIRSEKPLDCESAILAVLEALGPGNYRLGLPMPPDSEPIPLRPPPDRRADWPFFPPPLPELDSDLRFVMPQFDVEGLIRLPFSPVILRWANARYAPREDLQSVRFRTALESSIVRGVNIHSLFPDGTNHLHLDVKPTP